MIEDKSPKIGTGLGLFIILLSSTIVALLIAKFLSPGPMQNWISIIGMLSLLGISVKTKYEKFLFWAGAVAIICIGIYVFIIRTKDFDSSFQNIFFFCFSVITLAFVARTLFYNRFYK